MYVAQCCNLNLIMPIQCSVSVTCHCPPISLAFPWSQTSTIKCFFSVSWHMLPSVAGSHISHNQVLRLCLVLLCNVAGYWSEEQYSLLSIQVQYSLLSIQVQYSLLSIPCNYPVFVFPRHGPVVFGSILTCMIPSSFDSLSLHNYSVMCPLLDII